MFKQRSNQLNSFLYFVIRYSPNKKMGQLVIDCEECEFCFHIVEFQGQGHRCPMPESGTARGDYTEKLLELRDRIENGGAKPNITNKKKIDEIIETKFKWGCCNNYICVCV